MIVDDDTSPSIAPVTGTPAQLQASTQPRRQRDIIEDSDDGDWSDNADTRDNRVNELADDSIESSPPLDPGTPRPLDAEYDALFASTRDGNKRQRLSAGGSRAVGQTLQGNLEEKQPFSPESEPQGPTFGPLQTPVPRFVQRPMQDTTGQVTPGPSAKPWAPPLTATTASTQTPFRGRPRFVLSTQKPRSSQPAFRTEIPSATQPASPQERRKPAFVLPRSPSPSAAPDDTPAPFSPSSKTLRRRGRHRSGAAGYAPGGMAAEVRSWILEMGATHETVAINQADATAGGGSPDLGRYLVVARVVRARPAVLSSAGMLSFVTAEKVLLSPNAHDEGGEIINILLMGPPRSKIQLGATSSRANGQETGFVHRGDQLGIHRGLAWHVTFEEYQGLGISNGLRPEEFPDDESINHEQWLIAMQWDLID